MAARGASDAGRADAAHRRPHGIPRGRSASSSQCHSAVGRPAKPGLDRRTQCPDRVSLGRRRSRQGSHFCKRADRHDARRHGAQYESSDTDPSERNADHTDRIRVRRRPGRQRLCGQSGTPRQEHHRLCQFREFDWGKWVELFKEIAPHAKRVGFVFNPDAAPNVGFFHAAEAAAPSLGIKLAALAVRDAPDIEQGIAGFASEPGGGLIVAPHAVTLGNRKLIIELAVRYRLPGVYSDRYFAESGGLVSFGNNTADLFRRAATYIDLILKGANPADLPVQLPTKFQVIVNLKTAETLGLTLSESFLIRADEVIE